MKKRLFTAVFFIFGMVLSSSASAHALPLNSLAITACQTKQKSQACQYADHHNDLYLGTCQLVTETQLICVRNKPIQKADKDNVKHPIKQKIDTTAEQRADVTQTLIDSARLRPSQSQLSESSIPL